MKNREVRCMIYLKAQRAHMKKISIEGTEDPIRGLMDTGRP